MIFGDAIVYVDSVADTLKFYKEAFGFETRFLHESGQYGELETGNTSLAFASHVLYRNMFPQLGANQPHKPIAAPNPSSGSAFR
jgi:uncharacterized glyoxalase superfamily protein PhnB